MLFRISRFHQYAAMRRAAQICTVICLFLLAAGPVTPLHAAKRWVPYELVEPADLKLPKLSPIGRRVLKDPSAWTVGRSEHFTVFAGARHEVQNAVDDAENALARAGEWLNLDVEGMPHSLLVFVRDGDLWDAVMKGYGLRLDSLAMQLGRELYFRDDAMETIKPERVSHEVIQLALNLALAPRIPLWLEEGVACHFGWMSAVETYNMRGIALTGSHPVYPRDDLFALDELLSMRRYPPDPYRARVFYRQSEELTAVLAERLDRSDFAKFLHSMSAGSRDAAAAFREAAGLDDADVAAIVGTVLDRCSGTAGEED